MAPRSPSKTRSKEHHVVVGLDFLSAFKRGDVDACVDMLHPEIEWYQSPKLLESERLHGRDEVRNHIQTLHDRFAQELEVLPEDGHQSGDHVLMVTVLKGRNPFTGQPVKSRECWVISIRDDQWARVVVYPNAPAARLGFEEVLKASPPAGQPATNVSAEAPSAVTIPEPMEAAATPAEQANSQPQADAASAGHNLTFTFSFEEAEALNRWLLKPSQDGALAADDAAVRPALMKIRHAVEQAQAIIEVRRELEQAGVPTQHLSDQQVAQLGRRISQAAPRLGGAAPAQG